MAYITIKTRNNNSVSEDSYKYEITLPYFAKQEEGDTTEYLKVNVDERVTIVTFCNDSQSYSVISDHLSLLTECNRQDIRNQFTKALTEGQFNAELESAMRFLND